jgi:lysozyme family protein
MKIEKYTEFILESEFNEILLDIHMIVESEGKWTGERTYEWDLRGDNDEGEKSVDNQGDWLKSSIQKVKDFVEKLPKEKVRTYFVKLMNSLKSIPTKLRRRLIAGYLGIFMVSFSFNILISDKSETLNLDPEIKKEIVQVSKEVKSSSVSSDQVKEKKSNFYEAQKLVKGVEAGYSSDRNDSGNWIEIPGYGQRFIGTNWGISAQTLKEHLGRYPKKEDMMNLKYSEAVKIYKKKYWDPQNLSSFTNQSVANILYDACVNQGISATGEILRSSLKEMGVEVKKPFTETSIKRANELDQEKLFQLIKRKREKRYKDAKTWDVHGRGWMNRLAELEFKQNDQTIS